MLNRKVAVYVGHAGLGKSWTCAQIVVGQNAVIRGVSAKGAQMARYIIVSTFFLI